MRESMHKPHSERDRKRDLNREWLDETTERYDRERQDVINAVLRTDQKDKALTGRRVEQYEMESGIKESELFPRDGQVLNIGDPWQVMDRSGVVNLEYETGEEADFLLDSELFSQYLLEDINKCLEKIERISLYEPALGKELAWRIKGVREFAEGMSLDDYPKQAQVLYDALRLLGESHRADTEDVMRRELWYAIMRLARGLEDIHHTKTVIEPAIDEAERNRSDMTPERRADLVSSLISDFRGGKKYKQAELVKGAFPLTDFDDQSFDRIVASWSLSVHMFSKMNATQFETTFLEMGRLLKPDGVAYLWPLLYCQFEKEEMEQGFLAYRAHGGTVGLLLGYGRQSDVVWLDEDPGHFFAELQRADKLMVLPLGTRSRKETKNRVDEALIREDPWQTSGWGEEEEVAA